MTFQNINKKGTDQTHQFQVIIVNTNIFVAQRFVNVRVKNQTQYPLLLYLIPKTYMGPISKLNIHYPLNFE